MEPEPHFECIRCISGPLPQSAWPRTRFFGFPQPWPYCNRCGSPAKLVATEVTVVADLNNDTFWPIEYGGEAGAA